MGRRDVALHPEGVDRNTSASVGMVILVVALHPEGVDRNHSDLSQKAPM